MIFINHISNYQMSISIKLESIWMRKAAICLFEIFDYQLLEFRLSKMFNFSGVVKYLGF